MGSKVKECIKICRLCINNVDKIEVQNDLFEKRNKVLIYQIKELTGITLRYTSRLNYPRYICSKCKDDLSSSYEFRHQIIKSQAYFKSKEYQEKICSLNEGSKPENTSHAFDAVFVPSFDEVLDIKNFSNESSGYEDNDITVADCVETAIDVKTEQIDSLKCNSKGKTTKTRKRPIKSITKNLKESSSAIPIKKERSDELDIKQDEVKDTKVETSNGNNVNSPTLKKDPNVSKSILSENSSIEDNDDSEDSDFELGNQQLKEIALAIAEKENDTEDVKQYQIKCFLCERYFKTHFLLSAHWGKHHKGEKKCNQCDEKFLTRKAYEKHIRWHEGKEAYKCRYCDLTFKFCNSRTKHERKIHSRDGSFLCPICGKTFTTSDLGKNHMVVHTKERAFRCTVCNTSFLRKTHLTTHYRSETHKNNAKKLNKETETLPVGFPKFNLQHQGQVSDQLTSNIAPNNVEGYEMTSQLPPPADRIY